MALLEISDLAVDYGRIRALSGVSLSVRDGEIATVLGANGAGKSTLLRCLNFMEMPTAGSVTVDGRRIGKVRTDRGGVEQVTYPESELRAVRERLGMVF
ncbi:ATP-binding cassette domain-containing protein, partial [Acinetobacter baumannii]